MLLREAMEMKYKSRKWYIDSKGKIYWIPKRMEHDDWIAEKLWGKGLKTLTPPKNWKKSWLPKDWDNWSDEWKKDYIPNSASVNGSEMGWVRGGREVREIYFDYLNGAVTKSAKDAMINLILLATDRHDFTFESLKDSGSIEGQEKAIKFVKGI